ncbi:DUF4345 family protein [Nonomuraea polychroma]|uniref:DUF4345 family protein n=1 Tax=Nonomuraea polychroma TaxID=46176 RepID=UPI003D94EE27
MTTPATAIRAFTAVALLTGLGNAVLGRNFLPGSHVWVEATLAQKFRFFAMWWCASGVYLWSLAKRIHTATSNLRIVRDVLFASRLARRVSFSTRGRQHPMFVVVLAVIKVVVPLPLVWWQARSASTS